MKHLVCCKPLPDLDNLSVSQSQGRVFEKGKRKLNPFDEKAVEAALKAKQAGDEVIAIVVGGEQDQEVLKKPFAMGVDRGVFVKAEGVDGFVLANILRAAAAKLGCEKVWFGPVNTYGEPGEVAIRADGVTAPADVVPRTPNALAVMKAAKKPVERVDVELPEGDRMPRLTLRAEYLT